MPELQGGDGVEEEKEEMQDSDLARDQDVDQPIEMIPAQSGELQGQAQE